jgi:hypothetical protein
VATGLLAASMALWFSLFRTGPGDFVETSIPAFAVSQGDWHCAYPVTNDYPIPPLYPVVAGSVMALTGIGRTNVPVSPTGGNGCPVPAVSTFVWHGPLFLVGLLGLLGWPVLLAGLLGVVGAAGRRPTKVDVVGLCLTASAPPVAAAFMLDFHPEDLVAMGLILGSLAAALRRRWLGAGVLIGLACCTKQYALLAAVPLVLVAQGRDRRRLALGAVGVSVAVLVPLALAMGWGLVDALAGAKATPPGGLTLIGISGLTGWRLVIIARGCPLLLAAMTAFWARRRLGPSVMWPPTLTALVATSLALRLVFEVNLFDYYFLALSVALVATDMVAGRIRLETAAWVLVAGALFTGIAPLDFLAQRFPVPMQMVVALSGLTLAVVPLARACLALPTAPTDEGHALVLAGGAAVAGRP